MFCLTYFWIAMMYLGCQLQNMTFKPFGIFHFDLTWPCKVKLKLTVWQVIKSGNLQGTWVLYLCCDFLHLENFILCVPFAVDSSDHVTGTPNFSKEIGRNSRLTIKTCLNGPKTPCPIDSHVTAAQCGCNWETTYM